MGMTAAVKLRNIVANAEWLLAIELLAAAQGLDFRLPLQPGLGVKQYYRKIRDRVPHLSCDRALAPDFESIASAIRSGELEGD